MSPIENTDGAIATFYSYKGGVGRTMVLANVGIVLAMWGYRVLLVDWDLEGPGLETYLRPLISEPLQGGVVDLLASNATDESLWRRYVTKLVTPGRSMPDFLAAGGAVRDYPERVQRLDLPTLYKKHGLGRRLELMRDQWKGEYDLVLLDSRTGIGDIGGICTVQLPDVLCLCFTTNNQSFYGALEIAGRANRQRQTLDLDRGRLLTIPLITRFESSVEFTLAQSWERVIAEHVGVVAEDWLPEDVTAAEVMPHLRVPYVPHWSFGEQLPALEDDPNDPLSVAYAVETIAAVIARHGADPGLLVQNRQLYVEGADRSGTAGRRRASLFSADFAVVSDPRDSLYASQLIGGLREAGFKAVNAAPHTNAETEGPESEAAQHLVLLIGQEVSPHLQSEFRRFILDLVSADSPRILIPVVHAPRGAFQLPASLRNFQWINAWDRPVPEVVDEIAERVGRKAATATQRPSMVELDTWFNECDAAFQVLIRSSPAMGDRYAHGVWKVGYGLDPEPDVDLPQLRDALQASVGPETGWPEWMWADFGDVRPRIVDDVIECWLGSEDRTFIGGSHSDYWRASPKGMLYLLRGYEDDDPEATHPRQPGTTLDITLPIWRIAEALLHSSRIAANLGIPDATVTFRGVWTGLQGRTLSSWAGPRRLMPYERVATQDSALREISLRASDIPENLTQVVFDLLKGVYALFDFFDLPFGLVEEEVGRFRESRVR